MVVYLDVLFCVNLIMNYVLLVVTSAIAGVYAKRWRIFLSAVLGSIYALAVFFSPKHLLAGMIMKVLIGWVMVLVAFGLKNAVKICLLFFMVSFAFAGAIMGFFYMFNNQSYMMINGIPYIDISVNILVGAFIVCYVALGVVFKNIGKNKLIDQNTEELTLIFDDKQTKVCAFKDTGNSLCDNITGRPVIIVDGWQIKDIIPVELRFILKDDPIEALEFSKYYENKLKLRLISYNVIGGSGTMLVFKPDSIKNSNGKNIDALIGISPCGVEIAGCTAIMGV